MESQANMSDNVTGHVLKILLHVHAHMHRPLRVHVRAVMVSDERAIICLESVAVSALVTKLFLLYLVQHVKMVNTYLMCCHI